MLRYVLFDVSNRIIVECFELCEFGDWLYTICSAMPFWQGLSSYLRVIKVHTRHLECVCCCNTVQRAYLDCSLKRLPLAFVMMKIHLMPFQFSRSTPTTCLTYGEFIQYHIHMNASYRLLSNRCDVYDFLMEHMWYDCVLQTPSVVFCAWSTAILLMYLAVCLAFL